MIEKEKIETALWLPTGSIRAIGFLMAMGTFCLMTFLRYMPVEAFLPIMGTIIGYYYSTKLSEKKIERLEAEIKKLEKTLNTGK